MQVLHISIGFIERPPKLHIGYFEMTLHVGIAFRARYSYNFAIPTHVLIFTNYKFGLNFLNN
jgi:hypothetical protein